MSASRLPIKIDSTSNGEFSPVPVDETIRAARRLAAERLTTNAARKGLARRVFLQSLCGAATTLATFNLAFAARGATGGRFALHKDAEIESEAAAETLAGRDFIFDVQTHMVDPTGAWRKGRSRFWERALASFPQAACGEADKVACFSADHFIKEVFVDSDTHLAVLSFVPTLPEDSLMPLDQASQARQLIATLKGSDRLLLHGMVVPNAPAFERPLARMEEAARSFPIAAWKVYTQWGPEGVGWRLDDPRIGIPFIEKARELGIRTICIHKGLS
ncbi:MAG TPA: hypothetical protein VKT70_03810, partial [Stellaceae bacterium]|nr:hypothetical protein [Stellaceae bacterium]